MISVRNLTKYYGSLCAVNNITFKTKPGEILGLLGPNGAGKSTTMRMITGYIAPSVGSVKIGEKDIVEEPEACKKLIGYLPEFAPLYSEMVVHSYLNHVALLRGMERPKIQDEIFRVVSLCGLRDVMHQPFSQLSRGYKQRVGLAHAIIGDPAILILDEPTSGLDPNQIVEIRTLIREVGANRTVVFSTHTLSEAEAICDRIIIIHRGKIAADSTPTALKDSLKGARVMKVVLEDATFLHVREALVGINGVREVTDVTSAESAKHQLEVRIVCTEEARRPVSRKLATGKWLMMELIVERQSMEAVFRELTDHRDIEGKIDGR